MDAITVDYIVACAPNVAHQTIQRIIAIESGGNPIALNVNGAKLERQAQSAEDAVSLAKKYIAQGYSVDLGLMQINNRNLSRLGYTIEDMFQPCKNIAAGAKVLTDFYQNAINYSNQDDRLKAAISAYNTGSYERGFLNGYVDRFLGSSGSSMTVNINHDASASNTKIDFTRSSSMNQDKPVISNNPDSLKTPGVQVEYSPDHPDVQGAFKEDALTEKDAWASNLDLDGTAVISNQKVVR